MMTEKQKNQSKVKKDMKSLGTYKKEFDRMIEIYVDLNMQYDEARNLFEATGSKYETETGCGSTKKSAIIVTMENLRKDIVTYSDRLCLNPKTIENIKIKEVKQPSKLELAISGYENYEKNKNLKVR